MKVSNLEKILRAELAEVPPPAQVRENMLRGLINTVDRLAATMQALMPTEATVRVHTLDVLERPMQGARTFGDAVNALRGWHYTLRVARETFNASPDPHRLWLSISGLVSHLTQGSTDFAMEWSSTVRSVGMREGATLKKVKLS
jgi:hypothetical protein